MTSAEDKVVAAIIGESGNPAIDRVPMAIIELLDPDKRQGAQRFFETRNNPSRDFLYEDDRWPRRASFVTDNGWFGGSTRTIVEKMGPDEIQISHQSVDQPLPEPPTCGWSSTCPQVLEYSEISYEDEEGTLKEVLICPQCLRKFTSRIRTVAKLRQMPDEAEGQYDDSRTH